MSMSELIGGVVTGGSETSPSEPTPNNEDILAALPELFTSYGLTLEEIDAVLDVIDQDLSALDIPPVL